MVSPRGPGDTASDEEAALRGNRRRATDRAPGGPSPADDRSPGSDRTPARPKTAWPTERYPGRRSAGREPRSRSPAFSARVRIAGASSGFLRNGTSAPMPATAQRSRSSIRVRGGPGHRSEQRESAVSHSAGQPGSVAAVDRPRAPPRPPGVAEVSAGSAGGSLIQTLETTDHIGPANAIRRDRPASVVPGVRHRGTGRPVLDPGGRASRHTERSSDAPAQPVGDPVRPRPAS